MAKPDFRAAATSRLHWERHNGLSENVLRLLNGDEGTPRRPAPSAEGGGPRSDRLQPSADGGTGLWARTPVEADGAPGPDGPLEEEASPDAAVGRPKARAWQAILLREERRLARYGRPVTLMLAQLDGLDSATSVLGRDGLQRLISSVAVSINRNTRTADALVRTGDAQFLAVLPETDEIAAINYVERVRSDCDAQLGAARLDVRLAVGWAQVPVAGHLADALCLAEERMDADRLRDDFRGATSTGEPDVAGTAEGEPLTRG